MKALLRKDQVAQLAGVIRQRHENIKKQAASMVAFGASIVEQIVSIGAALQEAKAGLEHGQWLPFVEKNCGLGERQARRYMQIAANRSRVSDLSGCGSLRQCVALLDEGTEGTKGTKVETRRWVPYLEAIGRLSKLGKFIVENPINAWPAEGVEKFREDLLPVAKELWPERFSGD